MKRYIDANAIMEEMDKYIEQNFTKLGMVVDGNDCFYKVKELLTEAPTADVVEVVRCGECKYLYEDGKCDAFADFSIRPSASDFCSYGKRRE